MARFERIVEPAAEKLAATQEFARNKSSPARGDGGISAVSPAVGGGIAAPGVRVC
jgi:hypothetical protein